MALSIRILGARDAAFPPWPSYLLGGFGKSSGTPARTPRTAQAAPTNADDAPVTGNVVQAG
eukprot:5776605-Pyramimonas_sp.AAC.1